MLFRQIDQLVTTKLERFEERNGNSVVEDRTPTRSTEPVEEDPKAVIERFYSAVESGDEAALRSVTAASGSSRHALLHDADLETLRVDDIEIVHDESVPIEIRAHLVVTSADGAEEERVELIELRPEDGEWKIWSVSRSE